MGNDPPEKANQICIFVPFCFLWQQDLKTSSALLLSQLVYLSGDDGYCEPTEIYLSDLMNLSIRSIKRGLSLLEKNNYIAISHSYYPSTKKVKRNKYVLSSKTMLLKINENKFMRNGNQKGINIYAILLKEMSITNALILCQLIFKADETLQANQSINDLIKATALSKNTILKSIHELSEKGYIKINTNYYEGTQYRKENIYVILIDSSILAPLGNSDSSEMTPLDSSILTPLDSSKMSPIKNKEKTIKKTYEQDGSILTPLNLKIDEENLNVSRSLLEKLRKENSSK